MYFNNFLCVLFKAPNKYWKWKFITHALRHSNVWQFIIFLKSIFKWQRFRMNSFCRHTIKHFSRKHDLSIAIKYFPTTTIVDSSATFSIPNTKRESRQQRALPSLKKKRYSPPSNMPGQRARENDTIVPGAIKRGEKGQSRGKAPGRHCSFAVTPSKALYTSSSTVPEEERERGGRELNFANFPDDWLGRDEMAV